MNAPMKARSAVVVLSLSLAACSHHAPPRTLADADTVARSPAAAQAQELAPQASGVAQGLLDEAHALEKNGSSEEAGVVAEEALAAFEEAFALTRAARAEIRIERAKQALDEDKVRLSSLQAAQLRATGEADAFELRARVALDKEALTDVPTLTPERARARRQAAVQLASEARLLCVSALLLGRHAESLTLAQKAVTTLESELDSGSSKADVYPRAAAARTSCLTELTLTRRPRAQAAPDAAGSDRLLADLAATTTVFAFRDDRGVVVNLRTPTTKTGELSEQARSIVQMLARTSKQHPEFPLLVVGHSASSADAEAATQAARAVAQALTEFGAAAPAVEPVGPKQPVVDPRVAGAATHNSRVEIVFVTVAR